MTAAEQWIAGRLQTAPSDLVETMLAALPRDGSHDVPDALAAAALSLYDRVLRSDGGRADALPLLAADALLTHAFQAQAETNPTGIEAFARTWGGMGRLNQAGVQ